MSAESTTAEAVQNSIAEQTDDVPSLDDVEDELTDYQEQYGLPEDEAARSVISNYLDGDAADSARSDYFGSGDSSGDGSSDHGLVQIADIPDIGHEEWLDVRGKIIQVWEADSDSIFATFLIADESDETLKVTVWQKSADNNPDWPDFEEDAILEFSSVVTDEYQGNYSVKVNGDSEVSTVDSDNFDPDASEEIEFSGQVVDTREKSGLIKRCPEDDCSHVLENSRCAEHGQMEDFEWDLRIKAVLDDGAHAPELILDQEQVEALTGMDLADCQELAREHTDTEVVIQRMADQLMGKTLGGEATVMGGRLIANDVTIVEDVPDAEAVLQYARS
jgi:ssDNA-binding replication factor A large subunit